MQQRGIVHPLMLERIQPNFYPSLCTIQEPNGTRSSSGYLVPNPTDLPGHIDLPCRIAPRSTREVRDENQTYVNATHHIALGGYYPDITEVMLAVVDGTTYDIEGVEWDGNQKTTRLFVRIIDRGQAN
jgi:hypothetical protein